MDGRTEDPDPPSQVGPYRILEQIGEGGMGTVYLAEQRQPVLRRVALKVIKLGMDTKAVLARFQAEQQILAMLEHSCIAKVFDAGISAAGRPYFAMEYVRGIPITRYCDENRLDLPARLRLFAKVCEGVHHAHARGIVHRDLKPSNILVTVQDGEPAPRIIDFGLAKALNQRLVEATIFTEQGQVIGTPEYMSPEQAGLGGLGIDTRTDVYSLGVLLHELLTGTVPFSRRELQEAAYHELQRIIRESEPQRPSTRITQMDAASAAAIAASRQLDSRTLRQRLSGGLDAVVLKALAKDRTRRYQTSIELAADLGRILDGARPLAPRLPRDRALRMLLGAIAGCAALALVAVAAWRWVPASTGPTVDCFVAVEPADASLYVNGERVGSGMRRAMTLDFRACDTCYLQATHNDYEPILERLTVDDVRRMAASGREIRLVLRSR